MVAMFIETVCDENCKHNFSDVYIFAIADKTCNYNNIFNRFAGNSKSDETFFCAENSEPNF